MAPMDLPAFGTPIWHPCQIGTSAPRVYIFALPGKYALARLGNPNGEACALVHVLNLEGLSMCGTMQAWGIDC